MAIKQKQEGDIEQAALPETFSNRRPTKELAIAGFGKAVSRVGDLAAEIGVQIKEEDDIATSDNILNEFLSKQTESMGAYKSLGGEDAYKGLADHMKVMDKLKKDYITKGENGRQKQLLNNTIGAHINNSNRQATNHSLEQRKIWISRVNAATAESSLNDALNTGDPKEREQHRRRAYRSIEAQGREEGWGDDVTDTAKEKWNDQLHKSTIDHLVINDPTAARAYFEEHEDEIMGAKIKDEIEKEIKTASVRARGQDESDRILAEGGTDAEMREAVTKIEDPAVRDDARVRVNNTIAARKVDRAEAEYVESQQGWKDLEAAHKNNASQNQMEAIKDSMNDAAVRKAMTEWIASGGNTTTKYKRYYELRNMASSKDEKEVEKFKGMNLFKEKGNLSGPDFKAMVELQVAIKANSPKVTAIITPGQLAESTWKSMGLGKPIDNEGPFHAFELEYFQQLQAYELGVLGGKRKASLKEQQDIMNPIAMKRIMVDIDRLFWFTGNKTLPLGEVATDTEILGLEFVDEAEPKKPRKPEG